MQEKRELSEQKVLEFGFDTVGDLQPNSSSR